MGCGGQSNFEGGVWIKPTVVEGDFVRPRVTDGELSNPVISGTVTMSEDAAASVARALCPQIGECLPEVSGDVMAKVFKDCSGHPHQPGDVIPSCEEVDEKIQAAMGIKTATKFPAQTEGAELPTTVVGHNRDKLMGTPDVYLQIGEFLVPAYFAAGVTR